MIKELFSSDLALAFSEATQETFQKSFSEVSSNIEEIAKSGLFLAPEIKKELLEEAMKIRLEAYLLDANEALSQSTKASLDALSEQSAVNWETLQKQWDLLLQQWGRRNRSVRRAARVRRPPGAKLRSLADFLFSKKTFEDVFEQTLNDLQIEYADALSEGRSWKARWVWIRGVWSFWSALIRQAPIPFLSKILELAR